MLGNVLELMLQILLRIALPKRRINSMLDRVTKSKFKGASQLADVEVLVVVQVYSEHVAKQQPDVEVPFQVQVSTEQVEVASMVQQCSDSSTSTATTTHKQSFESIKEAEAAEVKNTSPERSQKAKSRQVNVCQPYIANEKECKRLVFESKDSAE
nr:hypothetical protein Iba_chr11aCG8600 [Ipomoea batatas]